MNIVLGDSTDEQVGGLSASIGRTASIERPSCSEAGTSFSLLNVRLLNEPHLPIQGEGVGAGAADDS